MVISGENSDEHWANNVDICDGVLLCYNWGDFIGGASVRSIMATVKHANVYGPQ